MMTVDLLLLITYYLSCDFFISPLQLLVQIISISNHLTKVQYPNQSFNSNSSEITLGMEGCHHFDSLHSHNNIGRDTYVFKGFDLTKKCWMGGVKNI